MNTSLILAALIGCAGTMPAAAAPTPVSFEFSGACTDCYGGRGNGTGMLVLSGDYMPGQAINSSNFLSFTYDGTDLQPAFTVTSTAGISLSGSMTGPFPDTETFSLIGPNELAFISDKGGYWCVGYSCTADYGGSHLWSRLATVSAVPEPGAWVLLLTAGLAGVALQQGAVRWGRTLAA